MSTWAQLLSDIRTDLKDTGTSPRWTDETLYLYAKDAIRDYSMTFQLKKRTTLTAVNGEYALPDDTIQVWTVECPANRFLEKRLERPGFHYDTETTPLHYYIEGSAILLDGTPSTGDPVILTYGALHTVPSSVSAATTLTIPVLDEELIRIYVKAKATEQLRTQQASLDRFKLGSGSRDDNPLMPETGNLMEEYRRKMAERIPGGVVKLWRVR